VRIVSPVFYALGRNRTPVIVGMTAVLVNASLNLMLVRVLSYRGLALGTSIAALFNGITLLVLLRAHLHGLNEKRLLGAVARMAIASALMGLTAFYSHALLTMWIPNHALLVQALRLGTAIGLAILVLGVSAWLLRIREFNQGAALVLRRFQRAR
jgi:putative peptidoglycan lipid II flippase